MRADWHLCDCATSRVWESHFSSSEGSVCTFHGFQGVTYVLQIMYSKGNAAPTVHACLCTAFCLKFFHFSIFGRLFSNCHPFCWQHFHVHHSRSSIGAHGCFRATVGRTGERGHGTGANDPAEDGYLRWRIHPTFTAASPLQWATLSQCENSRTDRSWSWRESWRGGENPSHDSRTQLQTRSCEITAESWSARQHKRRPADCSQSVLEVHRLSGGQKHHLLAVCGRRKNYDRPIWFLPN